MSEWLWNRKKPLSGYENNGWYIVTKNTIRLFIYKETIEKNLRRFASTEKYHIYYYKNEWQHKHELHNSMVNESYRF
jgi:hypothetical protein